MKQIRETQRSRRLHSDVPSVAIVGYTNAGKSSLLNALTGAGVLVENALFATLEPTTRRGEFDDGRAVVLTDTVGFVRHLPTQLIEAFRSTLQEVVDADLLVHVVDGSDVNPMAQIEAVHKVIREVQNDHHGKPAPELLVVNKIDAATELTLAQLRRALPGAVFVSAHTGEGMNRLRTMLLSNGQDRIALQIALKNRCLSDPHCDITLRHMLCLNIRIGIHRNRFDPKLTRGRGDTTGDFPAVSNQYCFKHFLSCLSVTCETRQTVFPVFPHSMPRTYLTPILCACPRVGSPHHPRVWHSHEKDDLRVQIARE
jgi:GTP-binding protein EngB required for normal cell division